MYPLQTPWRFPSNLSKSQLVLLTFPYFLVPYIHNHSTLVSADPAYPRAVFSRTVLRGTIILFYMEATLLGPTVYNHAQHTAMKNLQVTT